MLTSLRGLWEMADSSHPIGPVSDRRRGTANAVVVVMPLAIGRATRLDTLRSRSTAMQAAHGARHQAWRTLSLLCGIAFSLLFARMIWLIRYEGYSVISQVPTELTAIGASTQALWARFGWIDTLLEIVFGLGLWTSAAGNRTLRIVGGLILAHASLSLLWPFAAMHQREVLAAGGKTWSDSLHGVLGGVTVLLMFLTAVRAHQHHRIPVVGGNAAHIALAERTTTSEGRRFMTRSILAGLAAVWRSPHLVSTCGTGAT